MIMRMRETLRPWEKISAWRRGEAGMSEIASAFFVLPFMIALIFVLIEVGWNLRYRSLVDQIAQDVVRGISQDGANYWSSTSTLPPAYRTASTGWEALARARLTELCGQDGGGTATRCTRNIQASDVNCTVAGSTPPADIAPYAGARVHCDIVFPYKNVSGFMMNNSFMNLGFGAVYSGDIRTGATGSAVVGLS